MGNFLVRYASRAVIYDCRAVIRLATDLEALMVHQCSCFLSKEPFNLVDR